MLGEITVGLFGTCDNIMWRDEFIIKFTGLGINYFNPMTDNWHDGMIAEENKHLLNDDIILFPVLKESLGIGSLGEIGFSVLNAIRSNPKRIVIVYIDMGCEPLKPYDGKSIQQSINARALIRSKLVANQAENIIVVDSLKELMESCLDAIQFLEYSRKFQKKYFK